MKVQFGARQVKLLGALLCAVLLYIGYRYYLAEFVDKRVKEERRERAEIHLAISSLGHLSPEQTEWLRKEGGWDMHDFAAAWSLAVETGSSRGPEVKRLFLVPEGEAPPMGAELANAGVQMLFADRFPGVTHVGWSLYFRPVPANRGRACDAWARVCGLIERGSPDKARVLLAAFR